MVLKKELRKTLDSYLKVKFNVKEREMSKVTLDKKLFISNIELLREIEDRRDFMEDELGLDMSNYEEKFLQVIENLFRMYFNKEQFGLIQYYLYTIPTIADWDGMLDISDGKQMVTVKFSTPDELWDVISSLIK